MRTTPLLSLLLAPSLALSQKLFVVFVGRTANTLATLFDPPSIAASVGDSVQFQFYPQNHSVVQGDPQRPCVPLSNNGFFSSFQPVQANDADYPTFTINIENTDPIYFYCSQGKHCQNGMVGVINPPASGSGVTLSDYKTGAAAAVANITPGQDVPSNNGNPNAPTTTAPSSSTTTTTTTASNGGLQTESSRPTVVVPEGAFGGVVSSIPTSDRSPPDSSASSSPLQSSATRSKIAPIVGGIVGGVAALVGAIIFGIWLMARKNRRSRDRGDLTTFDIGRPRTVSEMPYGGNFSRGGLGTFMQNIKGGFRGERI